MVSVTTRIQEVQQPRGGYIRLKSFTQMPLCSQMNLHASENISPHMMGHVVDELLRFRFSRSDAFKVAIAKAYSLGEQDKAYLLLESIHNDLDDDSLLAACHLVSYDSLPYKGRHGFYRALSGCHPNKETFENIRKMVLASESFLRRQDETLIEMGASFEGAYTDIITKASCDFITKNTLWDLKTSQYLPNEKDILQVLVYALLARNSFHRKFHQIHKIGILNPRLNKAYLLSLSSIPEDIIEHVKTYVIGYRPKYRFVENRFWIQREDSVSQRGKRGRKISNFRRKLKRWFLIFVFIFIILFLFVSFSLPIERGLFMNPTLRGSLTPRASQNLHKPPIQKFRERPYHMHHHSMRKRLPSQ